MNNLNLSTVLVPVILSMLVVLLFIYFLNKVENRTFFKRLILIMLVLAFLLNFAWEVAQIPLYKGASFKKDHIAFCALASVADAIMVLLLYFGFAIICKNPLWAQRLTPLLILLLMMAGGLGAIAAEIKYLSSGTWTYNTSMLLIPIAKVGLIPVLQFMLLPASIYYLSFKINNHE